MASATIPTYDHPPRPPSNYGEYPRRAPMYETEAPREPSNPLSAYLAKCLEASFGVMRFTISNVATDSPGIALAFVSGVAVNYLGKGYFTDLKDLPKFAALTFVVHSALEPIFRCIAESQRSSKFWNLAVCHLNPMFIAFVVAHPLQWNVLSKQTAVLTGGILVTVKLLQSYLQQPHRKSKLGEKPYGIFGE